MIDVPLADVPASSDTAPPDLTTGKITCIGNATLLGK